MKIAQVLPQFASMTQIFAQNDAVKAALVVLYEDILDFYTVCLKFFRMSRMLCFRCLLIECTDMFIRLEIHV